VNKGDGVENGHEVKNLTSLLNGQLNSNSSI